MRPSENYKNDYIAPGDGMVPETTTLSVFGFPNYTLSHTGILTNSANGRIRNIMDGYRVRLDTGQTRVVFTNIGLMNRLFNGPFHIYKSCEWDIIDQRTFPMHIITRYGEVYSLYTHRYLKYGLDVYGYPQIILKDIFGKKRALKIHQQVAGTFVPNPDNKPQVNHIDGNKENNFDTNLEWVTPKENIDHAHDIGLRHGRPKLYSDDIAEQTIRLLAEGVSIRRVCDKLHVGRGFVQDMKYNQETRKHIRERIQHGNKSHRDK